MSNATSSIPQSTRKSNYWFVIPVLVVILIGALLVGFWMGSRSPSNQQPTGTQTNQNQLTIASFKSRIMENDSKIQAYLDLEVGHYWVEGNKVHCNGTIKWHTTDWTMDGMNVALCIDRTGTSNAVDAELLVYGGLLLLAQNTIDSDSVTIPKLGEQTFSYDFSLTCTYHQ